jgi:hypothetical protein
VLRCPKSKGQQAVTIAGPPSCYQIVDRLNTIVTRNVVLGRYGRFLFGSIRHDSFVVCST